jgi:hypothetical protein
MGAPCPHFPAISLPSSGGSVRVLSSAPFCQKLALFTSSVSIVPLLSVTFDMPTIIRPASHGYVVYVVLNVAVNTQVVDYFEQN